MARRHRFTTSGANVGGANVGAIAITVRIGMTGTMIEAMQKQSPDHGSWWRRRPTEALNLDDIDTGLRPLSPLPHHVDSRWAKPLGLIAASALLGLVLIATIGR
jgi:hypothetical protein